VASAADKDWVAHVKKPFRKSSHVIQYYVAPGIMWS